MSREIKFRLWDEECNRFITWEECKFLWTTEIFHSGEIIQQFTGFYDRDNKEIYEGDILEGDGTLNSEFLRSSIEFKYGKFVDSLYRLNLDFLAENSFKEYKLKRYKVIGNVFENPDLIKETK